MPAWSTGAPCYKAPVSDLPPRTDVAIIGAGFAGCATAWALAARGISALVLDGAPALGRYASGRGAGLGRQLTEHPPTTALAVRGAALLRRHFPAAWRPTGGLLGFDAAAPAAAYLAQAAVHGVDAREISPAAVLAHWPAFTGLPLATALHVPSDGVIDVRRLLAGLAAGRELHLDTQVHTLADGVIHTNRGTVACRVVVDATGAWAGALTRDPPLELHKRHLYVLEATAPADAPYFWHLGAAELYVRPDGGGLLASACDATTTSAADQKPTLDGELCLRGRLAHAAPRWSTLPVNRAWACQRAFTPDRTMRLGRDPTRPWLVWAAGLGGHGATSACALGELVAAAVDEALASTLS